MYLIKRKRLILLFRFLSLSFVIILILFYYSNYYYDFDQNNNKDDHDQHQMAPIHHNQTKFVIVITVCGQQSFQLAMIALKSILIFNNLIDINETISNTPVNNRHGLHFIIFTESELKSLIGEKLDQMNSELSSATAESKTFTYDLKQIEYPNMNQTTQDVWRKLFKPCASQRLFLPQILTEYDSVIYIDTDVLILTSITDVWSSFSKMNTEQIAAATYENEEFSTNWYYRFARHPYLKPYGINSGVMLMNLTKMRNFKWIERLQPILYEYQSQIVWGDQDIINIIFSNNTDNILILDCYWNYRPDHCVYNELSCKSAPKNGIKILHGNRGSFVSDRKQPIFRQIFKLIENFNLKSIDLNETQQLKHSLINELKNLLKIDHQNIDTHTTNQQQQMANHHYHCTKIIDFIIESIHH